MNHFDNRHFTDVFQFAIDNKLFLRIVVQEQIFIPFRFVFGGGTLAQILIEIAAELDIRLIAGSGIRLYQTLDVVELNSEAVLLGYGSGECRLPLTAPSTSLSSRLFAEISANAKRDYSVNVILQTIVPDLPRSTDVYIITPFVDDKMAGLLHALRHTGRTVEVILLSGGAK